MSSVLDSAQIYPHRNDACKDESKLRLGPLHQTATRARQTGNITVHTLPLYGDKDKMTPESALETCDYHTAFFIPRIMESSGYGQRR